MKDDARPANKLYSLPAGVQDYLPEECYNKHLLAGEVLEEFSAWGYDRLETAPLEYYDNFTAGSSPIDQTRMFKMTDRDGNIIVLSPDITLPIARLAVTKLDGAYPLRVCYFENVFDAGETKYRVQAQAGAEMLGVCGSEADFEVIALAVAALKRTGLADFKIDIGQVEFFKGLMEEHGLDAEQAERVRLLVDKKNMLGVELMLKELKKGRGAHEAILSLPSLFGGAEVIDRARGLCSNRMSLDALANLECVYRRLSEAGLERYISIDLGMVQRISYYTGIVFRGLSSHLGAPILGGGRYDCLTEGFGKNIPATGFALDVKKLLVALEYGNGLKAKPGLDAAVFSEADEAQTAAYLAGLRGEGKRAVRVYWGGERLKRYCAQRNISQGIILKKDGKAERIYGGL